VALSGGASTLSGKEDTDVSDTDAAAAGVFAEDVDEAPSSASHPTPIRSRAHSTAVTLKRERRGCIR
jgi:hypothetical protein